MTKYEEQKLLFDLIKKKKNASIKKCKLNPDYSINSDDSNDYDEK